MPVLISLILPGAAAVLAFAGYFAEMSILMWAGVGLAAFGIFMNIVSGASKLPVVELVAGVVGASLVEPWYLGAGLGLAAVCGIEAVFGAFALVATRRA